MSIHRVSVKAKILFFISSFAVFYSGCRQLTSVNSYSVNFKCIGGTIKAEVDGTAITDGASVEAGKTVTFSVQPNAGMKLSKWTGAGENASGNVITLKVTGAVNVSAECTKIIVHKISITQPANGKLTAMLDSKDFKGGEVEEGKVINFTAEPNRGFRVKEWKGTDNTSSKDNTAVLTVKGDAEVSVVFESESHSIPVKKFKVTITQPANGKLTAMLDSKDFKGGEVEEGKVINFTAEPNSGFRVKEWKGTDNTASKENTAVLTVKGTTEVSVVFESIAIPVKKFKVTITQPANGKLTATLNGNPFTGGEVEEGKIINFTATPNSGYRVERWENTDDSANKENTAVLTVKGDAEVSVKFRLNTFDVVLKQPQNGTLTAILDDQDFKGGEVAEGKIITFTATPNSGYCVKEWKGTDNTASKENTAVLTVKGTTEVSVVFEEKMFTVTFKEPANGKLTATLDGKNFTGGAVAEGKKILFTAIPNEGYKLLKWTNVNADPEKGYRNKEHTVTKDAEISVEFTDKGVPLTIIKGAGDDDRYYVMKCKTDAEGIIEVPDYVELINASAFEKCKKITEVKLPKGLTFIGPRAFYECTELISVDIPETISAIKKEAFANCKKLKSITMPDTVGPITISQSAFERCSELTTVRLPNKLESIEEDTFNFCSALVSVELPEELLYIKKNAFKGCHKALKTVTIPAKVIEIYEAAFNLCRKLEEVTILSTALNKIETRAFPTTTKFKVKKGSNVKALLTAIGIEESKIEEID